MATRERPGDRGAREARDQLIIAQRELRIARLGLSMSVQTAARRGGLSRSALDRLELGQLDTATVEQVCRAASAVGMRARLSLYPRDELVRDSPQLGVLGRFEPLLAPPLWLAREVGLPIPGDRRAWDARVMGGERPASVEAESRLTDVQATTSRIELKVRDDPGAGVVILLLNRTAHNRQVLAQHREALRAMFPLDGAAILRELRAGRVPAASGILLR